MSAICYLLIHLTVTAALRCAYRISADPEREGPIRYSRRAKWILAAAGLIYMAFSSARLISHDGMGGNDALIYKMFFEEANCGLAAFFTVRTNAITEPLFRILVWLVRQVTAEYRVFLLLIHGFMFLSVANFCRYIRVPKENAVAALCTFLLCGELFYLFCIMRNSLALAFGLWFYTLLHERKYGLALIPMLMAVGMHLAAVILIPVYVFALLMERLGSFTLKKTGIVLGALLLLECAALPVFNAVIRNTRYAYYLGFGLSMGTLAILLVLTVSFFLLYRTGGTTHSDHMELWTVLCAWFCIPLQMNYTIFYRSLLLFFPVFYRVIPSVFLRYRAMEQDTFLKKLIRWGGMTALIGYLLIRLVKMYTGDFTSYGLYPYRIG